MARSRPAWWGPALEILISGGSKAAAARAAHVRRETVSNAMRDPESAFSKELAARRAASTPVQNEEELVSKALSVLEKHLDSGDKTAIDSAKVLLARLGPQLAAQQEATPAEEEVTPADALRELAMSLPTVKVLLREHAVPAALVDELHQALRGALSDLDALPQPPPAPPAPPPPAVPPRPLLN